MKYFSLLLLGLLAVGCAHKATEESPSQARHRLEQHWQPLLGSATKQDFMADFGNPEWCKTTPGGEETCRFYKKLQTKWIGDDPTDKRAMETYDEIIADFGTDGTLRQFKANAVR